MFVCRTMDEMWALVDKSGPLEDTVETVWNFGGAQVYKEGLRSPRLHQLIVMEVEGGCQGCDTFLRDMVDWSSFVEIPPPSWLPSGLQVEAGCKYQIRCFEKMQK